MSVVGLIPARANSKGVPKKNIKLLAGRPLLAYSVEAGRASGVIDRLILSTDSPEIAEIGRSMDVEVPFLRPAELSDDHAAMVDVILHVLDYLAAHGGEPEAMVLLQPTAPMRRPEHIRDVVNLLLETGCDSVTSLVPLPLHLCPDYVMRIDNGRIRPFLEGGMNVVRRQDVRPAYYRDGSVYAFRPSTPRRYGNIYGEDARPIFIDPADSVTIDTLEDWREAEARMATASNLGN